MGLIPGSGRSPGEGNGNPLQYSCLENPMDRGAWWATVHGVTKSWTQLRNKNNKGHSCVVRVIIWLLANSWSHGGQREGLVKISSVPPFCQFKLKKCKPAKSAEPLPPNEGIYGIKEYLFETFQPGFPANELEANEWIRSGWNWTLFIHTVH